MLLQWSTTVVKTQIEKINNKKASTMKQSIQPDRVVSVETVITVV